MYPNKNLLINLAKAENLIWDLLAQGVVNKRSEFHCPTLSTTNKNKLNSRTIILRKVIESQKTLFFYTDIRSKKISDIISNKNALIHVYYNRYKLQVQFYGKAFIENKNKNTKMIWERFKDFQKINYISKNKPGVIIKSDEAKYYKNIEIGYNNFTLIIFKINRIECLQLNSVKNSRAEFIYKSNSTTRNRLVP